MADGELGGVRGEVKGIGLGARPRCGLASRRERPWKKEREYRTGVVAGKLQPVELAELFFVGAHGAANGLAQKHH
jgi:hypothetical protein